MVGQACIKINITDHLTDMGWNPHYNKNIFQHCRNIILRISPDNREA